MDKKLADLLAKHDLLDDNCREIFLTLLAYGGLRHNKLMNTLKQLSIKMTRQTLDAHLEHLVGAGLVECKTAFQYSEYSLTKEIDVFLGAFSQEELKKWLDYQRKDENLDERFRAVEFDLEKYYKMLSDKELDEMVSDDLNNALGLGLHELKNFIEYDLKLDKFDSDSAFWKLVGNPIYRMHQKTIVEKCRDSPEYKMKLFSRMEAMINEFRNK
jgi:DNA-binding HxlR family transcriptional regulator